MQNNVDEKYILAKKDKPEPNDPLTLRQMDYGIDINRRVIYYSDEIDTWTPAWISQRIDALCDLTNNHKSPVDLDITSPGGDVYGMLGTIDIIENAPVDINTLGRGMIMSAATFILAAGTGRRYMTRNSILMIHQISTWVAGTSKDVLAEADHLKFLQKHAYKLYEKYSNKKASYWENKCKRNCYFTADECLKLGLIDEII